MYDEHASTLNSRLASAALVLRFHLARLDVIDRVQSYKSMMMMMLRFRAITSVQLIRNRLTHTAAQQTNMSVCMSCHRSLLRPVMSTAASSSTSSIRTYTARAPAAWKSRTHTQKPARIPNPLPAIYPQLVILSDGSSFTSYTTSPSPATLRLTRDVTNNPLWNPASEGRRGGGEEEGGRLARFRARFGANSPSSETPTDAPSSSSSSSSKQSSFGVSDFDWMGEEAGVAEKVSAKEMSGPQKAAKGKRK